MPSLAAEDVAGSWEEPSGIILFCLGRHRPHRAGEGGSLDRKSDEEQGPTRATNYPPKFVVHRVTCFTIYTEWFAEIESRPVFERRPPPQNFR